MLIVLDNAESILDPQGTNGQEIGAVVEELSQFSNICLCITSRITTVPPDCKTLEIPTLSMEAGREAFYRIYEYDGQSDSIDSILGQLDFHPLSITLLATVAHQNKWDNSRLAKEWKQRHTRVLQTGSNKSLAHTVELSLASPMFRELGFDARGLLEVVAFFPQGIDESNLDWLFPTTSNRTTIFDTFCVLSLTYRNNGFVTMLAPLRDYLRPQDPTSSPLLRATKDRYFTRLSVNNSRHKFSETRWILSEDVNVEYLVDVFMSLNPGADEVWEAYANFITHLYWHKPRRTVLGQRIEGLPDDHQRKVKCLIELAWLFHSIGNHVEKKRHLDNALKLARKQGGGYWAARVLRELADASRNLGLHGEGIQQVREALEIYRRLGLAVDQARCLEYLARLLLEDKQLDAAKDAASQAVSLLPEKGEEYLTCESVRLLGDIYRAKGERENAIHHLEKALAIASPFNWNDELYWIHYDLVVLFLSQREYDSAHVHTEQAKSHAVNDAYNLGRAMELQAIIHFRQLRLEEAKFEVLRALESFEKLGVARDIKRCRTLLGEIEQALKK